jgi:hypothetical protein
VKTARNYFTKRYRSLTAYRVMKVFRSFGKEKLILLSRKIQARGKAHGLYGYSLPGLRRASRCQRPGHTAADYFPECLTLANEPKARLRQKKLLRQERSGEIKAVCT